MKKIKNYIIPTVTLLGSLPIPYNLLRFAISNANYESRLGFPPPYPDSYLGTVWHYLVWPSGTGILFISSIIVLLLSVVSILSKKETVYKKANVVLVIAIVIFIIKMIQDLFITVG